MGEGGAEVVVGAEVAMKRGRRWVGGSPKRIYDMQVAESPARMRVCVRTCRSRGQPLHSFRVALFEGLKVCLRFRAISLIVIGILVVFETLMGGKST